MKLFLGLSLVLVACGTEQSSVSTALTQPVGACGGIETHVIGAYDPGSDSTVVLERPGKHVLVLSAHEATTWHVKVGPGAEVVHIYAVGYHAQKVIAPAGIDIITESHDAGDAYATGYMWPSADTDHLLQLAGKRVHHDTTSFHGCHTASKWTIGKDMAVTSNCRTDMGYVQYDVVSCSDGGDGGGTCGVGSGSGDGTVL